MSNEDLQYHDDRVIRGSCQPLAHAVETAVEWLAERTEAHVDIEEMRAPTVADLDGYDYTADVVSVLDEWIGEDERLAHDGGGARLDTEQDSPEYAALRDALRAYIQAHVDLSEAAWQPTGRALRVYRDGTHKIVGGEP